MKRADNKNSSLETAVTKAKNPASAKVSTQEKPAAFNKKTVAAAEKPAKKSKPQPPVDIIVSAPQAKKPAAGKIVEPEKPPVVKKKTAAPVAAPVKKAKAAAAPIPEPVAAPVSKTRKPAAAAQKTRPKAEEIVPPAAVKKAKPPKEQTKEQTKEQIPPKIAGQKIKAVEKKAAIIVPAIKPKSKEKAKTAEKKAEKIVPEKIEIVVAPVATKPVKKKLKPIGSAVMRGRTGRYDFEVFPLDAELKDGSAIYVISKRITDKSGRGHHKFVCIGQTESLLGDLKKHKKDKCIKQHKANVVCLLREENEISRLRIETDLREAHTIVCNQK